VGNTKYCALPTTCYAAGVRISEAICLKPTDIDSQRMVIRVEQGKGQKDRCVMLSPRLLETLRSYFRAVRPQVWLFEGDVSVQPFNRSSVELACQKASHSRRVCSRQTPALLSAGPMERPKLEVADIFRRYGEAYQKAMTISAEEFIRRSGNQSRVQPIPLTIYFGSQECEAFPAAG